MISSLFSGVRNFVFDIQDRNKILAISVLPVVGLAWGFFRQVDMRFRNFENPPSTYEAEFEEIKKKNQIKKICAFGGLVQSIAYVAYHLFYGLSILAAINASPFLSMTLMFSAIYYVTAKINEHNFKSPIDVDNFGTTVW